MSKRKKAEKPALPRLDPETGKPICGAKSKRGGGICKRPPMANGRCYHHGGMTPAPGPTHPNYKNGRRSKYLPDAIARRVEEAYNDPELLSIRENVALVSARKSIVAERLDTGESREAWKMLRKLWGEFELGNRIIREAAGTDDEAGKQAGREMVQSAMDGIKKIIGSGASEENRWAELLEVNFAEAGLKQSEAARLQRLHQMMSVEEALLLIQRIHQAVISVVKDVAQQREIGRLLQAIMQTGSVPEARDVAPAVPAIPDAPVASTPSESEANDG